MTPDPRPRRRTVLGIVAAAAALPIVSGCADDSAAKAATGADAPTRTLSATAVGAGVGAGPRVLVIIRHAEKPTGSGSPHGVTPAGDKDTRSLTVQGWTRAGALIGLFAPRTSGGTPARQDVGLPRPTSVYAADPNGASKRPAQTVTPLAAVLGGTPDTRFAKGQERQLAAALLANSGTTLVAWEHESIPAIVAHLGTVTPTPPASWPDARFDVAWVFTRRGNGWEFSQVPQMLLAGDLPTPIA